MMGLTIKNHWPVMIIDDLPFIKKGYYLNLIKSIFQVPTYGFSSLNFITNFNF